MEDVEFCRPLGIECVTLGHLLSMPREFSPEAGSSAYVDGLLLARYFVDDFDLIACVHTSGLLLREWTPSLTIDELEEI